MFLKVNVCQNTVKAWQLVGIMVLIIRIMVPVILIITALVPI